MIFSAWDLFSFLVQFRVFGFWRRYSQLMSVMDLTRTSGERQAASRCRPPWGHCESCFQVILSILLWSSIVSFYLAKKWIQWSDFKISSLCEEIHEILYFISHSWISKKHMFAFFIDLDHSHNFACQFHVPQVKIYFHCKPVLWVSFFSEATHPKGCPVTKV